MEPDTSELETGAVGWQKVSIWACRKDAVICVNTGEV